MVQFKNIEAADRAVKEMNGKSILGLSIYLIRSLFSLVINSLTFIVLLFCMKDELDCYFRLDD